MHLSSNTLFLVLDKRCIALAPTGTPLEHLVDTVRGTRIMQYRILTVPAAVDIDPEIYPVLQFTRAGKSRTALHGVLLNPNKSTHRRRCQKTCAERTDHQIQYSPVQPIRHIFSGSRWWQVRETLKRAVLEPRGAFQGPMLSICATIGNALGTRRAFSVKK